MAKALTKDQKSEVSKSKSQATKRTKARSRKTRAIGMGLGLVATTVAAKTIANKPVSAKTKIPMAFIPGAIGAVGMIASDKPMVVAGSLALTYVGMGEYYLQQFLNRQSGQPGWRGGFNPDTHSENLWDQKPGE